MSGQKNDHKVRLIRQTAITSVLWAGTFVATKRGSFGHPDSLAMHIRSTACGR